MNNRINVLPVRAALAAVADHILDVDSARARKATIDKEVEEGLATADPGDEEYLKQLALRKTQADIMPRFIAKTEEKRPALFDTLLAEISPLEAACESAVVSDRDAFRAEWRAVFAPLLDKLGEESSALLDKLAWTMCGSRSFPAMPFSPHDGKLGAVRISGNPDARNHAPKNWEDAVIARAKELLAIVEGYTAFVAGSVKG